MTTPDPTPSGMRAPTSARPRGGEWFYVPPQVLLLLLIPVDILVWRKVTVVEEVVDG